MNGGPVTLNFAQPVSAAGAQINADYYGAFTAKIEAYNADGVLIASFTEDGIVTSGNNNSAIFIGIKDGMADIAKVVFYTTKAQGPINDFAINQVSLQTVPMPLALGLSDRLATPHALLTGTVYLDTPAPAGGKTVNLSSDGPAATVPASVVVAEGATTATFPVMTQSLASANKADTPTPVILTASDGMNTGTANFTVTPSAFARADTFVQDGPQADTNFGSAQTLLVSTATSDGTGGSADTYVKMRFNRFHTVRRAWLRVYASVPDGSSAGVTLYAVPDTTWGQDTLTFNNRPALGSVLKSVTIAGTGVVKYDIDVTRFLQTSLAANKTTVGLALHGPNAPTPVVNILSKETQDLKPQLIIEGN